MANIQLYDFVSHDCYPNWVFRVIKIENGKISAVKHPQSLTGSQERVTDKIEYFQSLEQG